MLEEKERNMRVLHYINQFFGQLGGEDTAYAPLSLREETVGPGKILQGMLEGSEIVVTAICGDNYFVENTEEVSEELKETLKKYKIDLVVAGPGFNAGRYGMACGGVCKVAFEQNILAVSALYEENPGLEIYKKYGYFFPTEIQARGMKSALEKVSKFVNKLSNGEPVGLPDEEGYFPRGIRRTVWKEKTGATRAVDMAIDKALGRTFKTEVEMPIFDQIVASKPVVDLSKARVAIATSGGMVPLGNPDKLEALSASKWKTYSIEDFGGNPRKLQGEVAHGGYDGVYGNEDGNRILPYDAFVELENQGIIGKMHEKMYVTVGNCMDVAKATRYGKEMAEEMLAEGVEAVLLTST